MHHLMMIKTTLRVSLLPHSAFNSVCGFQVTDLIHRHLYFQNVKKYAVFIQQ